MKTGAGTVEYTALQSKNHQKGGTDYRLAHAAKGSIKEQKNAIECQANSLTELQQMKKKIQDSDQYTDMKSADGEDMSYSQTGKGLTVFGRNQRTHSEE